LASYTVDWVKASVAVRCTSVPRAVKGPMDACIKLVFISIVTTPCSGESLRAAVAMDTSSKVIKAPPWVTPKELRCSGCAVPALVPAALDAAPAPFACPLPAFSVFYGERKIWWVRFRATGPAGHGSRFVQNTAVSQLHKVQWLRARLLPFIGA
jgi:hypothetical protein